MPTPTEDRNPMAKDQDWLLVNCHLLTPYRPFFKYPVVWMVSTLARVRVKAIYFVEKNYVDTSTTPFLKNCHLSSRKILDIILFSKFQGVFPLLRTVLLLIFFVKKNLPLFIHQKVISNWFGRICLCSAKKGDGAKIHRSLYGTWQHQTWNLSHMWQMAFV